jgi:hypothetical protein
VSWSRSETRSNGAAAFRPQNLDDLAALIDRAVHRAPHTGHLHRDFIDEPAITNTATTRPRRVDHEQGEALHPTVNRDVNDLDAAFGEEFFNIAVRQARAEVPARRQHHHGGSDHHDRGHHIQALQHGTDLDESTRRRSSRSGDPP